MLILAVESSCDETAVALVRDGREIVTDQIFSQAALHAVYGGVVPEIASRSHVEVISQLASGSAKEDIIAGIHHAIAGRVSGLAHRIGIEPDVVMTGGVAQNRGVVDALKEALDCDIQTSELTQYNGALGAALYAFEKVR